jgi:biopolymer transport protein ExbB
MAVLSSIITITPILGLLGTVIGLMDIFNVLSSGPIDDAQQLSGGIAQALITTVTGLSITIPLIIMQRVIQEKTHRYIATLDACIRDVVELCKKTAV